MKLNLFKFMLMEILFILSTWQLYADGLSITWTGPGNKSQFKNCAEIPISAEATIDAGAIKTVEFYRNGSRLLADRSAPYETSLRNVPNGWYSLYAKAIAEDGTEAETDPVLINVGGTVDGDLLINGEFNCALGPWRLDNYENAMSTIEIIPDLFLTDDSSGALIDIAEIGNQVWGVQLMQTFKLQQGHTYEVSFYAEADEAKDIQLTFSQDYDPWAPHWTQDVTVEDPQEYGPYTFECPLDDDKVMFKFVLGGNTIPIYIDAVKVVDQQWSSVEEHALPVAHFELSANYPNPFNPTTRIDYTLPTSEHVDFSIYDVLGRQVYALSRMESAGRHTIEWNGLTTGGSVCPSGIYFYQLKTEKDIQTRRMHLLR